MESLYLPANMFKYKLIIFQASSTNYCSIKGSSLMMESLCLDYFIFLYLNFAIMTIIKIVFFVKLTIFQQLFTSNSMYYQTHNRKQTIITKFYSSRFSNVEDTFSIIKIKPISKHKKNHKCQISCRQHRFILRKVSNQCQQYTIIKKIEDVNVTFCPNQFFGMVSGGFPVFNFDGKSYTPAFEAKYELSNTSGNVLHSQQFLKRKQKIEKQKTIVDHPNSDFVVSQSVQSREFSMQIISEFQEILKQKNRVQAIKFQ